MFRVLFLRRFGLPLPLASSSCRCGRPLDVLGHHRAACSRARVFGSRVLLSSQPLPGYAARRVAGSPSTCSFVTSICQWPEWMVVSRLSWMACPCSGEHNSRWTPPWFLLFELTDDPPPPMCSETARLLTMHDVSRPTRTQNSQALMGELGWSSLRRRQVGAGLWKPSFCQPAVQSQSEVGPWRQAYHHRLCSILACAASRAFALSLLERRPMVGADGDIPTTATVVSDCRYLPVSL